jgi:hypothetical protein
MTEERIRNPCLLRNIGWMRSAEKRSARQSKNRENRFKLIQLELAENQYLRESIAIELSKRNEKQALGWIV